MINFFIFICMVNLGGYQLFLQMVRLNEFGSHKKKIEKHYFNSIAFTVLLFPQNIVLMHLIYKN